MRIKTISIIALAILSYGCKEEQKPIPECKVENTVKIPQEALERFVFKEGSYWIYSDSVTGKNDSVWVWRFVESVKSNISGQQLSKRCYQEFFINFKSDLLGEYRYVIVPNAVIDDNVSYNQEIFSGFYNYLTSPPITVYSTRFKGNILVSPNQEGGTFKKINSLVIDNKTFNDILMLSNPPSNDDIYTTVYYVRNIGIVKFELKDGRVWELKRRLIKQ